MRTRARGFDTLDHRPFLVGAGPRVYRHFRYSPADPFFDPHRRWRGRLRSPTRDQVAWADGENVATCMFGLCPDGKPERDCSCGFYAYYSPAAARLRHYDGGVLAVVEAYGVVHHGTAGVRAGKAAILGVAPTKRMELVEKVALASDVARHYPHVRFYDSPRRLARAYGMTGGRPGGLSRYIGSWGSPRRHLLTAAGCALYTADAFTGWKYGPWWVHPLLAAVWLFLLLWRR